MPLTALAVVVVSICAGCGGTARSSCVPVPGAGPGSTLASGAKTTVAPGALVWVALVEPYMYSVAPYPQSFPWNTPISSDKGVVQSVRLCPNHIASSLNVTYAAFRAAKAGRATVTAALAPAWQGRTHAVQPYRAVIVVQH